MRRTLPILLLAFLLLPVPILRAGGGPWNVLLLVNDKSSASRQVGEHYAKARGLDPKNVLHLSFPPAAEMPYWDYEKLIREPVRAYLEESGLKNQIDYIVATMGFPLRLTHAPGGQRYVSLTAALQALDIRPGVLPAGKLGWPNPYYGFHGAFSHRLALREEKVHIYLSTMLAGYTVEDAESLVDHALQAEGNPPPKGLFLFQDARGNAKVRNPQYDQAVSILASRGFQAKRVPAGTAALKKLPPLICWFSGGSYSGLTREAVRSVTFRPGALVDMLESFGAVPENFDPKRKRKQVPVAWMIEAGATAVHGAVAEPYNAAFPDCRAPIFYAEGFNVAEAVFQCLPTFFWQNTLFADPLCAPYAAPPAFQAGLDKLLPGPVGGKVQIPVKGKKVGFFELYVDGILAARAPAGEPLVWDTLSLPDGPVRIRVVALSSDPTRTPSSVEVGIPVYNPSFRVLGVRLEGGKKVAGPLDSLEVRLSRPPGWPVSPQAVLVKGPGGKPAPCDVLQGRTPRILRIVPIRPLAASSLYTVELTPKLKDASGKGLEAPYKTEFRTTAAALAVTGPERVKAGERAVFTVEARTAPGSEGARDEGFFGALRVKTGAKRADCPPLVNLEKGTARLEVVFRKAETTTLRVEDPESGLSAETSLEVLPGPFSKVEVQAPKEWPAGHALGVTLLGRDSFGNLTPSPSPPLQVYMEGGEFLMTELKESDQGRKEVFLSCPWKGESVKVVVRAGSKEVGTAQVKLLPGGIRRWLALGPFRSRAGARPDLPPPPKRVPEAGLFQGGKIWIPRAAKEEPWPLDWLSSRSSCWVAAPLAVEERVLVRAVVGLSGAAAELYLDGRKLASGTSDTGFVKDAIRKKFVLPAGVHWLGLALTRAPDGRPRLLARLEKAGGGPPEGVCVWPYDPDKRPSKFFLSGRVKVAWHGIPGIKVELEDSKGRKRTAKTDREGLFVFSRLAKGTYTLRPLLKNRKWTPPQWKVRLRDAHAWGRDFLLRDKKPPRLEVLNPKPGPVHRVLHVRVKASDDLGIHYVEWQIDGKPRGKKDYSPPYTTDIYLKKSDKGRHTFTVIARDFAGNETKKEVRILVR